jgi:hypothetical protein
MSQAKYFNEVTQQWEPFAIGGQGPQGLQGETGPGVAVGGLEGQILAKSTDTDFDTEWIDNYAPDTRIIVKNDSGVTLPIGTPVMSVGAVGDRIRVAKAVADGSVEPRFILGVTFEEILDGEEGFLTLTGDIKGVNTNSYTLGDILYIDPNTPGTFTTTQPLSPNLSMAIAIVTKVSSSAGHIFVRMWDQQSGLHEQHDVLIDTPADNDLVVYTDSLGVWENKTPAEAGLSEIGHDHNDLYYSKSETDTAISDAIAPIEEDVQSLQDSSIFPIKLNEQTISANYSIPEGYNGLSAGPITIADEVVVTIPSGSSWSII